MTILIGTSGFSYKEGRQASAGQRGCLQTATRLSTTRCVTNVAV
jgi:hypothetical protein